MMKIIIICCAMGVALLGLMILAVCLYRRNRKLYEAKVPVGDMNSPDFAMKMEKNIKHAEMKLQKLKSSDSSVSIDQSNDVLHL
mmetsp:Transcript_34116/g.25182  ORF Transcript_34116/g.25182 Transcript_34116/m.25182 type:complete len:84 (-) Transcript_34116:237-488(-)